MKININNNMQKIGTLPTILCETVKPWTRLCCIIAAVIKRHIRNFLEGGEKNNSRVVKHPLYSPDFAIVIFN